MEFLRGTGWSWNLKGVKPVIYRLPEVANAQEVIVVEGEKDADNLANLGFVATTSPMGAGKWKTEYSEALKDKKVILCGDNDEAGHKHVQLVGDALQGIARSVKVLELPDLPPKGDISDWIATFGDSKVAAENLSILLKEARPFKPTKKDGKASLEREKPENGSFNSIKPLDIFGDTVLAGTPDLLRDMVPDVIADYAWDEAERLGVDPAMIAVPALAVCASCITDEFKLQPKVYDSRWKESARLWVGVVAKPGERKTPALAVALELVKKIERELYVKWKNQYEEFEKELRKYEAATKKEKANGLEEPKPPPQPRMMIDDATIEALCSILEHNPDGVLCLKDELSGWFSSFDCYHPAKSAGKDRAAWLELYNGGPKQVDRVYRGRIWVDNWSACLVGGIQPGPMRRLMGKITDDGLVARFIIIRGKTVGDGVDSKPNYRAIKTYEKTIARLVPMTPAAKEEVIRLSQEAQEYRHFVSKVAQSVLMLPDTSDAFKGHLSKWGGLFARITLTYHLIEAATQGILPAEFVSGQTAERVAKFMLEFLLPNSARFYNELMAKDNHVADARWIAGYILSRENEKITARDIGRAYRTLRGETERIAKAMHTLWVAGWANPLDEGKGRFPSKWEINPLVHEIFAERAQAERQRREEERTKIQAAVDFLNTSSNQRMVVNE